MGRRTTGRVFKRGDTYWLDYAHNGQRVRVSLDTTRKREAESKAAAILRPLTAATDAERRREVLAAVRTAEEVATEAERALKGLTPLARVDTGADPATAAISKPAPPYAVTDREWRNLTAAVRVIGLALPPWFVPGWTPKRIEPGPAQSFSLPLIDLHGRGPHVVVFLPMTWTEATGWRSAGVKFADRSPGLAVRDSQEAGDTPPTWYATPAPMDRYDYAALDRLCAALAGPKWFATGDRGELSALLMGGDQSVSRALHSGDGQTVGRLTVKRHPGGAWEYAFGFLEGEARRLSADGKAVSR